MFSVEAMKPAVFTTEPAPKTIPFGLIRNTRPFEPSRPRMLEASWPTTRLSTALAADGCTKRVTSPRPIENAFQLMIVPGVFVTVSALPEGTKLAEPAVTCGPVGFANDSSQHASMTKYAIGRSVAACVAAL